MVDDGSRDGTVGQWLARCRRARAAESGQSRQGLLRAARHAGSQGRVGAVHRRRSFGADRGAGEALGGRRSERAPVAIGSRALDRSLVGVHQPVFREYAGRFFNVVMRVITGLPFQDTQCGFKLFDKDAARAIFSRSSLSGSASTSRCCSSPNVLGLETVEVAVRWNDVAGTKVGTLAGLNGLWTR